jgi:hypothetical protein
MLQELHGIGSPGVTRADLRPEARWPRRAAKGPGERREALEAEVAGRRRTLSNGFQAIQDLKTIPASARVDSVRAKTTTTIVTHVEADLEENTPQPPTWRAKCRWISCRKNRGYHATDPKIRTQGAERGRSWIATKHSDGSLECQTHYALQRGTPSFTQVQGPRGEVKPLLPAFLYCDAIPREEYKVLVTKL